MNVKEAMDFYKCFLSCIPTNPYKEAAECSINALEKQIPKRPIEKDWVAFDVLQERDWFCPACNVENMISYGQPYCCECGQALDWS
jgi:hypothetical protein